MTALALFSGRRPVEIHTYILTELIKILTAFCRRKNFQCTFMIILFLLRKSTITVSLKLEQKLKLCLTVYKMGASITNLYHKYKIELK